MRHYATKAFQLNGKQFNRGDLVPDSFMNSPAAKKNTRAQGAPKPAPELPEIGMKNKDITKDDETTKEVRAPRQRREDKPKVAAPAKVEAPEETEPVETQDNTDQKETDSKPEDTKPEGEEEKKEETAETPNSMLGNLFGKNKPQNRRGVPPTPAE